MDWPNSGIDIKVILDMFSAAILSSFVDLAEKKFGKDLVMKPCKCWGRGCVKCQVTNITCFSGMHGQSQTVPLVRAKWGGSLRPQIGN